MCYSLFCAGGGGSGGSGGTGSSTGSSGGASVLVLALCQSSI